MPFPLIKLGTLAIKQLSKPLANLIKRRAKNQGFFRDYICIPFAQRYHSWDVKVRGRLAGLGKTKDVKPLNPEMAVELGADMLGEAIIFSVAVGALYIEYWRASRKDQVKESKQNDSISDIKDELNHLNLVIELQDAKIRALQRHIGFVSSEPELPKFKRGKSDETDSGSYLDSLYGAIGSVTETMFGKRTDE